MKGVRPRGLRRKDVAYVCLTGRTKQSWFLHGEVCVCSFQVCDLVRLREERVVTDNEG